MRKPNLSLRDLEILFVMHLERYLYLSGSFKMNQQSVDQDDITPRNNTPDMSQILASLDSTVELINNLREGRLNDEQLNNVLRSHISTLEMLFQNYVETARFMALECFVA